VPLVAACDLVARAVDSRQPVVEVLDTRAAAARSAPRGRRSPRREAGASLCWRDHGPCRPDSRAACANA
jgi:hypothetical protein